MPERLNVAVPILFSLCDLFRVGGSVCILEVPMHWLKWCASRKLTHISTTSTLATGFKCNYTYTTLPCHGIIMI